jgi:hypothetical protein
MKLFQFIILLLTQLLYSRYSQAIPFGAFDPRAMAMGGTGVAMATGANAGYFNPAMLARYSVRKELADNSRLMFPVVSLRYSETLSQIDNFRTSDLETRLVNTIDAFNTTPSTANAQSVVDASRVLQGGLEEISSGPFDFDANVGFVLGIPSNHEGGAIIYNKRAVGDGVINQTAADNALLNDYIEGLTFVASGGAQGAAHPELFDAGGNLIDQTGNLTSTARGTAVVMTEVGMSFAREFRLLGQKLALGVTPKYVKIVSYDLSATATASDLTLSNEQEHDWDWNLDLGAEKQLNKAWRAGLVLKNIVGRDYATGLGSQVHIAPQLRAGVAYEQQRYAFAADVDITANDAIGAGDRSQIVAFGGEWRLGRYFKLLGGVQHNFRATGDQKKLLFSAGMQSTVYGVLSGLSYAYNGVERSISAQIGYRF